MLGGAHHRLHALFRRHHQEHGTGQHQVTDAGFLQHLLAVLLAIAEVEIQENTVGQLLGYVCEEAIQEVAPFGKWPSDMRRAIGANYRDISFTFYYY
jgi:hypothetical protein